MTRVKTGVVDNYIKKNPHAPLSVVVRETGCNAGTVYLARKRLGLPTRAMDQHAVLFDTITGVHHRDEPVAPPVPVVAEKPKAKVEEKPKPKKQAVKTTVINTDQPSAHDQIASLYDQMSSMRDKLDFATTVNKALVAAVVVLAFVGTVPLVLPYFK